MDLGWGCERLKINNALNRQKCKKQKRPAQVTKTSYLAIMANCNEVKTQRRNQDFAKGGG